MEAEPPPLSLITVLVSWTTAIIPHIWSSGLHIYCIIRMHICNNSLQWRELLTWYVSSPEVTRCELSMHNLLHILITHSLGHALKSPQFMRRFYNQSWWPKLFIPYVSLSTFPWKNMHQILYRCIVHFPLKKHAPDFISLHLCTGAIQYWLVLTDGQLQNITICTCF